MRDVCRWTETGQAKPDNENDPGKEIRFPLFRKKGIENTWILIIKKNAFGGKEYIELLLDKKSGDWGDAHMKGNYGNLSEP